MLTVIIKAANGCNLACSYCSVGEKIGCRRADGPRMAELFRYACRAAAARGEPALHVILHGGEPTLVDPAAYRLAIDGAKAEFPDLDMRISMQSNGLSLGADMLALIRGYDIHMGISLDGPQEIHDSQRLSAEGEPTYRRVVQNIERLEQAGVRASCLMVLTRPALDKGYAYLTFFEERGIHLKINPLLPCGGALAHPELALRPGDYASYLIGLYEYVLEQDIRVSVAPIDPILYAIVHGQRIRECSFQEECSRRFLCLDDLGNIYPCGKCSDMDRFRLGTIWTTPPGALADSPILRALAARRGERLPSACRSCRFVRLCHGGCSAQAALDGEVGAAPALCADYRMLFAYFHDEGLARLRRELERQRAGLLCKIGG